MRSITLATVTLLAAACASVPPVTIRTEHGRVRGHDREGVERVARALRVAHEIRHKLDSTRADPPEVWLLEEARTSTGAYGTCYARRITLARDALALDPPQTCQYYVAHEVAHWYTNDSPYASLPLFLKEGLADYVALEIVGLQPARRDENDWINEVRLDPRDLWVDIDQLMALPSEYGIALQRIGYEVVARLGYPRLRDLVASRTAPLGYLEAAGMTPRVSLRRTPGTTNPCFKVTWYDSSGATISSEIVQTRGHGSSASGQVPPAGAVSSSEIVLTKRNGWASGQLPAGAVRWRIEIVDCPEQDSTIKPAPQD